MAGRGAGGREGAERGLPSPCRFPLGSRPGPPYTACPPARLPACLPAGERLGLQCGGADGTGPCGAPPAPGPPGSTCRLPDACVVPGASDAPAPAHGPHRAAKSTACGSQGGPGPEEGQGRDAGCGGAGRGHFALGPVRGRGPPTPACFLTCKAHAPHRPGWDERAGICPGTAVSPASLPHSRGAQSQRPPPPVPMPWLQVGATQLLSTTGPHPLSQGAPGPGHHQALDKHHG